MNYSHVSIAVSGDLLTLPNLYTDRSGCWAVNFSASGEGVTLAAPVDCCWTG